MERGCRKLGVGRTGPMALLTPTIVRKCMGSHAVPLLLCCLPCQDGNLIKRDCRRLRRVLYHFHSVVSHLHEAS